MKKSYLTLVLLISILILSSFRIPESFALGVENTLVANTTNVSAVGYSFQIHSFRATTGRSFVFYSSGVNLCYNSSTDGTTFNYGGSIRACTNGVLFSIWYNESSNWFSYVYTSGGLNTPVYYRRGTPNSDGSITWIDSEQTAIPAVFNLYWNFPMISADSGGYDWIALRSYDGGTVRAYATFNNWNNGTWNGDNKNIIMLLGAGTREYYCRIVPLSDQNIYVTSANYNSLWIHGKLLNKTTTFSTVMEETICTDTNFYYSYGSTVDANDVVHVCYLNSSQYWIKYANRTSSGTWTTPEDVYDGTVPSVHAPSLSYEEQNNTIVLFYWTNSTVGFVYRNHGSVWSGESVMCLPTNYGSSSGFSSSFKDVTNLMTFTYSNGTGSPYDVRYSSLTMSFHLIGWFLNIVGSGAVLQIDNKTSANDGSFIVFGANTSFYYRQISVYPITVNASWYIKNITVYDHLFNITYTLDSTSLPVTFLVGGNDTFTMYLEPPPSGGLSDLDVTFLGIAIICLVVGIVFAVAYSKW